MWESITNINFKRIEEGYLFFPWSPFGTAYHVHERKKAVLTGIVEKFCVGMLAAFFIVVVVSWWAGAVIWLLSLAYYHFAARRELQGARRSNALLQ